MPLIELTGMELPALQEYLQSIGQPKFRAAQLFDWIHQNG